MQNAAMQQEYTMQQQAAMQQAYMMNQHQEYQHHQIHDHAMAGNAMASCHQMHRYLVCCSVLQCARSVLQCVAMCCSVLQAARWQAKPRCTSIHWSRPLSSLSAH